MAEEEPIDILTDFRNPLPAADWVLPSMLAGTIGAVVSPGGLGKSMLAWQIAAQIAGGPDLLGIGKLPLGRVAYLPAEDYRIALRYRVQALAPYLSAEEEETVASNVLIQPLRRASPDLMNPASYDRLLRLADGRRLMLLDTLRRFHNEDENASGSMAQVLGRMEDIADETGCAIIFLHHVSKGASFSGNGDQQQASRGSSVLTDNIRWQAYLAGMTTAEANQLDVNENQKDQYVRFGLSKVNYGPPFQERWLKRNENNVFKNVVLERKRVVKERSNRGQA